jgi:RNA polymerase sigma factor (sigma-70 family)
LDDYDDGETKELLGKAIMANHSLSLLLRYIRQLAKVPGDRQTSDQELVQRYLQQHDQSAFELLVRRHGAMVFQVAQRLLHQEQDAEDVFQATFLTLARKAGSLRKPGSVACWLHGVAHRLALQTREARGKRFAHESRVAVRAAPDNAEEITLREARGLLDEELRGLSVKYRAPLVLCYLEGATRDEAARQLHVSLATLKRRLERGRELLRVRLSHRGLTVSSALAAVLFTESTAQTAVRASLLSPLVQAALLVVANKPLAAGLVSPQAVTLTEGMVRIMWITKLQTVAFYGALAVAVTGTGVLAQQAWQRKGTDSTSGPAQVAVAQKGEDQKSARKELPSSEPPGETLKFREGKNYLLSPVTTELQRSLLPWQYQHAWAYVIIDGGTLARADGTIDAAGLDWETLRKAIRPPKDQKEAGVVFHAILHDPFPPEQTRDVLSWCLEGFGHHVGFTRACPVLTMYGGYQWDTVRAAITKQTGGEPDAAEPKLGNDAIEVYAVRTILSRYLTDNADCVVRIVAPFMDQSADPLEPEVDQAIRTYVNSLRIKHKDRLFFRVAFKQAARKAVQRFEEKTSVKLATELGFKKRIVESTPEP